MQRNSDTNPTHYLLLVDEIVTYNVISSTIRQYLFSHNVNLHLVNELSLERLLDVYYKKTDYSVTDFVLSTTQNFYSNDQFGSSQYLVFV